MVHGNCLTRNHRNFQYTNKRILENDFMALGGGLNGIESVGEACLALSIEHEVAKHQANQYCSSCDEQSVGYACSTLLPLPGHYCATALTPVVSVETLTA